MIGFGYSFSVFVSIFIVIYNNVGDTHDLVILIMFRCCLYMEKPFYSIRITRITDKRETSHKFEYPEYVYSTQKLHLNW